MPRWSGPLYLADIVASVGKWFAYARRIRGIAGPIALLRVSRSRCGWIRSFGTYFRQPPSRSRRKRTGMNPGRFVDLPARFLMSLLFLLSGFGKLAGNAAIQKYMQAYGMAGALSWSTAAIFHTAFSDQNQMTSFFNNMTMVGGFPLIVRTRPTAVSVDTWRLGWPEPPLRPRSLPRGRAS